MNLLNLFGLLTQSTQIDSGYLIVRKCIRALIKTFKVNTNLMGDNGIVGQYKLLIKTVVPCRTARNRH
ncbi:hypothetical protein PSPTOT1_4316 [Pseudomonas syringae pv. tomato T1]|nr:hypothetical protein PSPTOT1_4316 [Pseudomonas syringae pv. tomato T1]